jgi:hypothetical protein
MEDIDLQQELVDDLETTLDKAVRRFREQFAKSSGKLRPSEDKDQIHKNESKWRNYARRTGR